MAPARTEVPAIRLHCAKHLELVGSPEGREHLENVYQSVRYLSTRAGLASCSKIARLTGAIEAMLFDEVMRTNGAMSPSCAQTLVKAVDCLDRLCGSGSPGAAESPCKPRVLLVDDDAICNMANEVALKRADYDTVSAPDGGAALMLLADDYFDL